MSASYFSKHEAGTHVSSPLTIVHPEIVGTYTDVLSTMENTCFFHTQRNYLTKEHTVRVVGHMVLVMAISHIAMHAPVFAHSP